MEGANHQVSILTRQFNDLCFGFNNLLDELRKITQTQDDCRIKWLEAKDEVRQLKGQLHDLSQSNTKLESQCHHTTELLKNEIKARTKLQEEKKFLEGKLKSAREIVLSAEQDKDDIKSKLEVPSSSHRRVMPTFAQPYGRDWLRSTESSSTAGSSGSSMDLLKERQTDEELELSKVRSSRAASRTKRTSEEFFITTEEGSQHRSRRENSVEISGHKRLVAKTTVTIPKEGPITTTSVIESHPEPNEHEMKSLTPSSRRLRLMDSNQHSPGHDHAPSAPPHSLISPKKPSFFGRRSASVPPPTRPQEGLGYLRPTISCGSQINQRRHQFSQKTIIRSENCLPCGNRIKFGKPALKCVECRETCHVDCKSLMPIPCVPTKTTSSKGFAGTVADYSPTTSPMIPGLVVHCVNEIEKRGMSQVGIYRVNGSEKEIQDMKERLLQGKFNQLRHLSQVDIHVVTGALKLFFRSLKEPLITYTLWESFADITELDDEMDVETLVYSLVPELPQPNRDTLAFMLLHLQRVADSRECKMPVSNLSRIFGPTIIGHSCPDPDPELSLKENKKQSYIMEKLLEIPSDYWARFVTER